MSEYFWTVGDDRGDTVVVTEGGHYEALERRGDSEPKRASLKQSGTLIPSSDIPEVCVSASPEASLFAKIQGSKQSGTYVIYRTDETPDTDVTTAGLDFAELEEYRYTMQGERAISFERYEPVSVPQAAIDDVELAYNMAEQNRANTRIASAVKTALRTLIESGAYDRSPVENAIEERFRDFASSYGFEQAKRLFGDVPDGVEPSEYD